MICWEFLPPIFRGSPADPFGEGVRKDERILVADFLGDGFNGLFGSVQQFRGATHPEIGDLVNGTASELTLAKAAQVFFAVTGFPRQTDQRPKVSQAGRDTFPEQTQAVIVFPRLGEAQDITMNQLHPMLNHGGVGGGTPPLPETPKSGMEGAQI